jgi:predicted nucleic acid-binding protein
VRCDRARQEAYACRALRPDNSVVVDIDFRVSPAEATGIVRDLAAWPVVDDSLALLQVGLDEQSRWGISLWDALILAAARGSGASELITEDLNHGQDYGGIRVLNPFL